MEIGRKQDQNSTVGQEIPRFTEYRIDMNTSEDVSICKTNWILLSLLKYKLTYIEKKSSLTRVYLKRPRYNKSYMKSLLTIEKDRISHTNQLLNKVL